MDLSNKSLALLLLAAVVISLGGTIVSLNKLSNFQAAPAQYVGVTGKATANATAQLNIQDSVGCAVDTNVDFGSGSTGNVNLTTDAINSFSTFTNCTDAAGAAGIKNCTGMEVNNTGNVDLIINLSGDNSSNFLGGSSVQLSDFRFYLRNGTYDGSEQGCRESNATMLGWGGQDNVTIAQKRICNNLTSIDSADMMTIEYNVTLRDSTPSGQKTANINVTCIQA